MNLSTPPIGMARGPAASSSWSWTSQTARFTGPGPTVYFLCFSTVLYVLCFSMVLLQFHFECSPDISNEVETNGADGDSGPVPAARHRQTPRSSNDGNPLPPPPPEPFAYRGHECYQPTSPKPYEIEYCRPETHPALRERIRTTRKVLITYGQNCCERTKRRACDRGLKDGKFDICFAYNETFLDAEFATAHADVLRHRRGAGYWLWKPHVIRRTLLERMDWNEYLVYHDAGAYFTESAEDLLLFLEDRMELNGGALFFSVGHRQSHRCKRDAFVLQNCDTPECHDRDQIDGYLAVFKKTEHALTILDSWLKDAVRYDVIADDETFGANNKSGKPELEGFRKHRHDQAVLTNVMNRDGWWYDWVNGPVHGRIVKHDRLKGRI